MAEFIVPADKFEEEIARTAGYKELIRCKDCIYYTDCLCWNVPKNESPRPKEGTFFCSDGKRKGGEQE